MSDFFGGVLDSIQGYAKDVNEFFDSSIGEAASKAYTAGRQQPTENTDTKDYSYNTSAGANVTKNGALTSVDFGAIESEWLGRMKSFAKLDTGTSVKLG